jgi:ABC-2 type transport system ATP-binding protein
MEYDIAIQVSHVKKKFKSYADKATSLKERFLRPSSRKHEEIWVLNGISMQIKKGEAVGIIGKNGCGKSTLLKLLTKILQPNEGQIEIDGRVSSLIELGAGFHPDMTGRENIYTNASIFGIKHKEVDRRLEDIIRFSELEEFIDQPVRTYSSGMYMRLAFAVAINVDADILLIDEILAVGDSAFQKKCFEKLKEIKENGTTIVIVSHSMDQMYRICDRLIWIENGLIKDEGAPRLIGKEYLDEMEGKRLIRVNFENQQIKEGIETKLSEAHVNLTKEENQQNSNVSQQEILSLKEQKREIEQNESLRELTKYYRPGARRKNNGAIKFTKVIFRDNRGNETNQLLTNQEYTLELHYVSEEPIENIRFVIGITRDDGIYCYGTYLNIHETLKCQGVTELRFQNTILKGNYVLDLWIETFESNPLDAIYSLMTIEVDTPNYHERGFFSMSHKWIMKNSTEERFVRRDH